MIIIGIIHTMLMHNTGVVPRLVGTDVFEALFDELHAHSAMADLGRPTSLLFPEFVELCVSIADTMTMGTQAYGYLLFEV